MQPVTKNSSSSSNECSKNQKPLGCKNKQNTLEANLQFQVVKQVKQQVSNFTTINSPTTFGKKPSPFQKQPVFSAGRKENSQPSPLHHLAQPSPTATTAMMTKVSQLAQASGGHLNYPVAGCSPRNNFYNNGTSSSTVTAAVGPQSMTA